MNEYGVFGVGDGNPLLCAVEGDCFVNADGWIEFLSSKGDVLSIVRESLVGFIVCLAKA